jgi:nitrous oxide reductase accessory protein NosL
MTLLQPMRSFSKSLTKEKRQLQSDPPPTPMRGLAQSLTVWVLLLGLALPALGGQQGPTPAKHPLAENRQIQLSPGDRCPVCGMKVINYAKFAGAIQLTDGITFYFCSAGCLIRTWLHPEIFIARAKAQLKTAVIQEYFSGQMLDARSVIWVAGSDVIGPMGPAIVPLRDEASLKIFINRHGGRETFLLDEMNDERWFAVTGKNAGR